MIAKLNLDPRLMLADDMAGTQQEREKVLTFFNAMLEGDMGMLRTMVSSDDVLQLEALADLGGFEDEVLAEVDTLELHFGTDEEEGGSAVLAWFAAGMDDQVQMWTFETLIRSSSPSGATPKWWTGCIPLIRGRVVRLESSRAGSGCAPDEVIKVQAFLDEGSDEAVIPAPTAPVSAGVVRPTVGVPSAVGASHQWCPDRTIFWLRTCTAFG